MNTTSLIKRLAQRTNLPAKTCKVIVDELFRPKATVDAKGKVTERAGVIATEIARGRRVMITSFGCFSARQTGWRDGHNPSTGEVMRLPPSQLPAFKSGGPLKEYVKAAAPEPEEDPIGDEDENDATDPSDDDDATKDEDGE